MNGELNNVFYNIALLRLHNKLKDDISNVSEVKELLGLLKDNKLDAQVKDFELLLNSVDEIFRGFKDAMEQDNRNLIRLPYKDKDNNSKISKLSLRESAIRLKVDTYSVKHEILQTSLIILDSLNVKDFGYISIKGNEFDVIKQSLSKLGLNIKKYKIAVNPASDRFSQKSHTDKNDFYNQDYKLVNPYNDFLKTLHCAEENVANAVKKVDALSKGNMKEKPSILQKLKEEKANIIEPTTTKPKVKEKSL